MNISTTGLDLSTSISTPIEAAGTLALLLPTRGRPSSCERLFDSIRDTASQPQRIFVRCLVDDDDSDSQHFLTNASSGTYPFKIEVLICSDTRTQGERYNLLRAKLRPYPEYYMPLADDVVFATTGWDKMIFDAFDEAGTSLLMCYPHDDTITPDKATYTIIHADWTNATGRFGTAWFPFWYEDSWVDQVGELIGGKTLLPFDIIAPEGKGLTQGMRNLPFWERFFRNLLDERVEEARKIIRSNSHLSKTEAEEREALLPKHAEDIKNRFAPVSDDEILQDERMYSGVDPTTPPGPKYLQCEALAVWWLKCKLWLTLNEGHFDNAAGLVQNISLASPETLAFGLGVMEEGWKSGFRG